MSPVFACLQLLLCVCARTSVCAHTCISMSVAWGWVGVGCCAHMSLCFPRDCGLFVRGVGMESLFPAPFWEVLYQEHLQGNLSLLSANHSLLPPHLLLNTSHGAFLPLGLKVTIVGLYLAVCIGGLLGNCLVMYVILR